MIRKTPKLKAYTNSTNTIIIRLVAFIIIAERNSMTQLSDASFISFSFSPDPVISWNPIGKKTLAVKTKHPLENPIYVMGMWN